MTTPITIKCTRAAGDREANPISDAMITTEPTAVARGKRFLDDPDQGGYYRTRRYQLTVPHKSSDIVPNTWVTLSAPAAQLDNVAAKVAEYTITIKPDSIMASMMLERYIAP